MFSCCFLFFVVARFEIFFFSLSVACVTSTSSNTNSEINEALFEDKEEEENEYETTTSNNRISSQTDTNLMLGKSGANSTAQSIVSSSMDNSNFILSQRPERSIDGEAQFFDNVNGEKHLVSSSASSVSSSMSSSIEPNNGGAANTCCLHENENNGSNDIKMHDLDDFNLSDCQQNRFVF